MRKILHNNPMFQMVKISNYLKSLRPLKIYYYLQLKFPNNNITHGFPKKTDGFQYKH